MYVASTRDLKGPSVGLSMEFSTFLQFTFSPSSAPKTLGKPLAQGPILITHLYLDIMQKPQVPNTSKS
jgi:hypothetical protein